jgi:hypothetical protein
VKSKGFTYVLLAVVAVVWYQVFVRVKSNFAVPDQLGNNPPRTLNFNKKILKPRNFDLKADFRDPFLTGNLVQKLSTPVDGQGQVEQVKPAPVPKKVIPISWPTIKYYGFVRNTSSKNPRAVISIDNYVFKLQAGEEVWDNIRVVSASKDELKIYYKGEYKVFEKKQ